MLWNGMPRWVAVFVTLLMAGLVVPMTGTGPASAETLSVQIDLSDQRMRVHDSARVLYSWPVSTARSGYCTPVGTYRPIRLERMWYSTIYDNAPMPHSIFFRGGYAIHGTTDIAGLGQPASHGCVRLHPDHARTLFELVLEYGRNATRIVIKP